MNLPYTLLNQYKIDEDVVWKALEFFKNHPESVHYRNNNNTEHRVTTIYGNEQFIGSCKDILEYKYNTIDAIARNVLKDLELDIDFSCFILVTKKDCVLKWHIDAGGVQGPPSAAFMYNLNKDTRAPTEFIYNDKKEVLNSYKCAIINTSCIHQVDNRGFGERYNLRISLYGPTFEEIRDKVNLVKEKNYGKYN